MRPERPVANLGRIQIPTNKLMDMTTIDSQELYERHPEIQTRSSIRANNILERCDTVWKSYKEFDKGEFIVDGLPGCNKLSTPPGFDRQRPDAWELTDSSWLIGSEPKEKGKLETLESHWKGIRLLHKGNQQPGEQFNTKKDGEEIFFYLPSKLNKDWAQEVKTGDDGKKKGFHHEWEEFAKFFELVCRLHPKIVRGALAKGFFEVYAGHGARVDRSCELGDYAFKKPYESKKTQKRKKKRKLKAGIMYELRDRYVNEEEERCNALGKFFFETMSRWLAPSLPPHDLMSHRRMLRDIEADTLLFGGEPEQLLWGSVVAAYNYIVRLHSDDDMTRGAIGCINLENVKSDEIITHMVFPDYEVAIALRSGDLLLFDPTVRHCSTNPRDPKGVIFSVFNKKKCLAAFLAQKDQSNFKDDEENYEYDEKNGMTEDEYDIEELLAKNEEELMMDAMMGRTRDVSDECLL